jgi:Asp-tRNA(Asn)/Glu-tRNA(Gln) amidotransferase A subunit family amidase
MFDIGGLPLGLQVLGFSERDSDLFAVAAALQESTA